MTDRELFELAGWEPVAWIYLQNGWEHFTDDKREWYDAIGIEEVTPLYTETQLLAVQQRTAEACAKAVERLISGDGICADNEVWIHDCADAIRRGDWREYL